MLVYSPDKTSTVATGANLIDIENSFRDNFNPSSASNLGGNNCGDGDTEEAEVQEEEAVATSGSNSDESMNCLLHGRNARNPYQ